MKPRNTFDDNRGTGLVEIVVVISIIAILAGVGGSRLLLSIEDARVARAVSDTEQIAVAILNFAQDTGFAPAYKSGEETSGNDDVFYVLETDGDDAIDDTNSWPTDDDEIDRVENHLIENEPDDAGPSYRRVGEISFNRHKGWNGPYVSNLSKDPWGDRYLVNVQFLTPQGVDLVRQSLGIPTGGGVAVVVLSAGANRTIETRFDQLNDSFVALGDDIIYRIQ